MRSILDGHVVLDRAIAERGRYPAVNVNKSVSRTMPRCNSEYENDIVMRARRLLATYEDMEELIRLGAYRRGSDPAIDEAIHYYPMLEEFLSQGIDEVSNLEQGYEGLAAILGVQPPEIVPEDQAAEENVAQPEVSDTAIQAQTSA